MKVVIIIYYCTYQFIINFWLRFFFKSLYSANDFLMCNPQNLFTLTADDAQLSVIPKNLRERYKTNKNKPPLVEIGGMRAKDGWVAISETGLVS